MFGTKTAINVTTPDQGLAVILKECACQDNVVNYLKEGCGVANTSDFFELLWPVGL